MALTDESYNEIVEELKKKTSNHSNVKKRILRKGYCLLNFPALSLRDVLCTPIKEVIILELT